MKTKRASLLMISLVIVLIWGCKESERLPKQYTIAQFMDIVQISDGAFSADDSKILISSKETGIYNAVEIDIKTGEQKQLTTSTDDAIFGYSYFPKDNRAIYGSDKGGNEITHIYVLNHDGSSLDLIKDSTAKATFYGWSYNQKFMYYTSNSRDEKRFFDLYKVQVAAQKEGNLYRSELTYKNEKGLDPVVISNDDRFIALSETITTNNSNMYLLDTQTGSSKLISEHAGNVQYTPQFFSLDGKKLFYLTDEGSEYD